MAEHAERQDKPGWRGAVSEIRGDMSVEKADERLQEVVSERPLVRHLLDLRTVLTAVAVAAVLTLITFLLFSGRLAGLVLFVSFFGAWVFLASRRYEQRRSTRDASEGSEDEEKNDD